MKCQILLFFTLATASARAEMQEGSKELPIGILDDIIIKILDSIRPQLENLKTGFQTFETGDQEFGNFRGHFNEVTVEGLEKFQIKIIQTSLLDIKNLTIVEEKFKARGSYKINGTLAFPFGKNDIHFFGDGFFGAELSNFSISINSKLRKVDGINVVKDLNIIVELEQINVNLTNLMDGGELQNVFNRIINDVGLTVINYYKEPVLEFLKPRIIEFVEKILNRKDVL